MSESKKRLVYTAKILETTDKLHPITAGRICDILENEYDITTERRTVGRDIKTLTETGMDIVFCKDNRLGCYLNKHLFDDRELKFLLDCVDNSMVLCEHEAKTLREKLLSTASENMKKVLMEVSRSGQNKGEKAKQPEFTVMDNMQTVLKCMETKKKLSFQYGDLDNKLKLIPRRNGSRYIVNPYVLLMSGNKYYLICNYDGHKGLAYYRLDKFMELRSEREKVTNPKDILGESWREQMEEFIDGTVRNYGGSRKLMLVLRISENMIGYINDEFKGRIMRIAPAEGNSGFVDIYVNTTENEGLYYLLMQYGSILEIMAPEHVREKYKDKLKEMVNKYER